MTSKIGYGGYAVKQKSPCCYGDKNNVSTRLVRKIRSQFLFHIAKTRLLAINYTSMEKLDFQLCFDVISVAIDVDLLALAFFVYPCRRTLPPRRTAVFII